MAKILIVEDEIMLREIYQQILEAHSHTVTTAENGLVALKEITKKSFDVVILDLLMPELNGVGFLRRAKLRTKYPSTCLVILSNLSASPELDEALSYKPDHHEIKANVSPGLLVSIVANVLKPKAK